MTSGMVLDSSIALSWCFEDQAGPATDALLEKLRHEGALAPALWCWEVADALTTAVRRGRITPTEANVRFTILQVLPIVIDAEALDRAWRETFALANAHALTAYDAAYLELASRMAVPLATKDSDLRKAATTIGVAVLP